MTLPTQLIPITLGLLALGGVVVAFIAHHLGPDDAPPMTLPDFDMGIEPDPRGNRTRVWLDVYIDCDQ